MHSSFQTYLILKSTIEIFGDSKVFCHKPDTYVDDYIIIPPVIKDGQLCKIPETPLQGIQTKLQ